MVVFPFLLSLSILILVTRFIYEFIWIPFHVQHLMRSQGIVGPSYKIIHGSTKESFSLKQQARSNGPMELSHDIFSRVQPNFSSWMELYGKNFLTWNGPQPHLVVTEPELIKEILSDKEGIFLKIKAKSHVRKLLGDGLLLAEGTKWMKLRNLANHAFYAESLKGMVPAMVASVKNMLENWKQYEGKEIEVSKEFKVLSSEVISRTAFGSSYLEGKNIFDMLKKLGIIIFKNFDKIRPFGIEKIWKSQDDIESDRIEQSLRDSIMAIVRKREEKVLRGQAENYGGDFLGLLLRAHQDADEKNRISLDNIIDECKVFNLAGHETTSSLLSWTFLLLAIHTEWQEKAREEVVELFGQEYPTAEGLPRMKVASMIINEALRLYNPAAIIARRVKRGVRLGKYKLPADMELHIPALALHRNPEIWGKDAHLFKPERFAEGVAMATRDKQPIAFLPFSFGPRACVGLNFASNEVKIALSMILQRYKFTLSSSYVHSPVWFMTIIPQHGVQILLKPV